ncbi:MAG: hypothetical protein PHC53_04675 [Patescibacteria group bacterium]|nr:hypothetical protein [Patescibacteria group bacterium]
MRLTPKFNLQQAVLLAIALVSLTSIAVFLATPSAHAQILEGLKTAAGTAGLPGKPSGGLEQAIGQIIGSVMGLVGSILFVYMLYGGFRWMVAGGDAAAVGKAQAIIRNAIIGIAIIIFAYTLSNYVVGVLTNTASGAGGAPSPTGGSTTGCPSGYSCMDPGDGSKTECPTALGANGCSATQACCKAKP